MRAEAKLSAADLAGRPCPHRRTRSSLQHPGGPRREIWRRCHLIVTFTRTSSRKMVQLRGFEPLTFCMPYRPGPSPDRARRRPVWRLPAATAAGRRLLSAGAWRRWLPTWLPAKSLAGLILERVRDDSRARGDSAASGPPCHGLRGPFSPLADPLPAAASGPAGATANPPPCPHIGRQRVTELLGMRGVQVDLIIRGIQPEPDRPLSGAAVDVIDEQGLHLLTAAPFLR